TAGTYFLTATVGRVNGLAQVQVADSDLENVAVVAGFGFKIFGRVVVEGLAPAPGTPKMWDLRVCRFTREPNIFGMPFPGPSYNPPPLDDGSFTLEGIAPGDFRVAIRGVPPDGYVKSMRMGNTDVLDAGLHLMSAPENPLVIAIGTNAGRVN